ncbi:hypothetical protein EG327_001934 [Venturia inaequalis]|uniref:Uncharacterized protein n=1 Tax=Venturia inaequalis TaxID=5025 RepID=A0A8H3VLU9_VENIN|nr:hypothetical protein EG327_001934 [Venturia inaequalis]
MFLAIHAALQVFRPAVTIFDVDDGIYAYRLYAYLTIFFAPIILASLAFIHGGYVSQGVFCALPRDPLWSRLVLGWVPRWIIVVIVIGLAIGVYAHVSRQLEEFSNSQLPSKASMKSDVALRKLPALISVPLPFPKRKQKARDRLAGIDEEDERRRSSAISAIHARIDPAQSQSTLPPVLVMPQYNQTPTTRTPITPGLVSPGASAGGAGTFKSPDYFSLKPLTPILKLPQYNQGTQLTPITPGLVSPTTTDPLRMTPVMIKDFAQADYFNVKPALSRKTTSDSSPGPSNAIIITQPWDRHGQLPHFMSNASSPTYSAPSKQPIPPGGRAPGRRVSIEYSSQYSRAEREGRKGSKDSRGGRLSLPLADQHIDVRRNSLKKALRGVFVYPAVFVVFWIPPCAKNMLGLNPKRAENDPLWLAVLSTLCVTLMGAAYCLVFQWSERPWRHFVDKSRIWKSLYTMLCLKQSREPEEEDGGDLEFPPSEKLSSTKGSSTISNNTGIHTLHGEARSQAISQHMSKIQTPESAAVGGRRGSRLSSISFAPMGQHLAGGSTTSLARQLALERLNLEQQDRKSSVQFQRRLSMRSGPSRMSSMASGVTSLGSIVEATRKEWWDEDQDEIEEGERHDSDQEEEEE